jgi:type VI secretion system secreted protein VgrG
VTELRIDDLNQRFAVATVHGRETLSRAYRFDVQVLTARRIPVEGSTLVGRPATLFLPQANGTPRIVRGMIAAQRLEGHAVNGDRTRWTLRVVPRLWFARHRKTSRIFQDRTAIEIVTLVLARVGVRMRSELTHRYPRLEYCVQYRESDYDFVTRLLGEHGVSFSFEHPEDPVEDAGDEFEGRTQIDDVGYTVAGISGHATPARVVSEVMVLRDTRGAGPTLAEAMQFGATHDDHSARADVTEFSWREVARPTSATVTGFDFRSPLGSPSATASTRDGARDVSPYPIETLGLDVYDHHDEQPVPSIDARSTRVALERARRCALIGNGRSINVALTPGLRFALESHPVVELNRAYRVTEVRHTLTVPELASPGGAAVAVYENRFQCVPASEEHRPAWRHREPVQTFESALVMGPPGEAVHTDEHGRVRVRFSWDRSHTRSEESTCWMRVSQGWAGAGYGAQFVPRPGMEVLVGFLDGDVDRPVVVGTLYNGINRAPFALPEDRTRVGFRTRSSEGEGFNELSFEDRHGAERVHLRAERDLDVLVRHERRVRVEGDDRTHVEGNDTSRVVGSRDEVTQQDHRRAVFGDRALRVGGGDRTEVMGDLDELVRGERSEAVLGHMVLRVGTHDARRSLTVHTEGRTTVAGTTDLTLTSNQAISLRCGPSMLRLTPTGIELEGPRIDLRGSGASIVLEGARACVRGDDSAQITGREVVARSAGASLGLTSEAHLDGTQVCLRSPTQARDPVRNAPRDPTVLCLRDTHGRRLAGERWHARLDDGTELAGVLDTHGETTLYVNSGGAVSFQGFRDGASPASTRPYVVRQGDYLAGLAARFGFDPEAVWSSPSNAALRAQRRTGEVLLPGDVLHLPRGRAQAERFRQGARNEFTVDVATIRMRVVFEDHEGALNDEACEVLGVHAEPLAQRTDAQGGLDIEVPVGLREFSVRFARGAVVFPVRVGELDPIDTRTGLWQRLRHLGFEPGPAPDERALRDTLAAWQRAHQLPATGLLDDETRRLLEANHRS